LQAVFSEGIVLLWEALSASLEFRRIWPNTHVCCHSWEEVYCLQVQMWRWSAVQWAIRLHR